MDTKALAEAYSQWVSSPGAPLPEAQTLEEGKFLLSLASASFAGAMGDLHVAAKILREVGLFDKFEKERTRVREIVKARRDANVQ